MGLYKQRTILYGIMITLKKWGLLSYLPFGIMIITFYLLFMQEEMTVNLEK